ncbi:conserved membrane domain protein, partial [Chlamydia psittaci 84-8471/1]
MSLGFAIIIWVLVGQTVTVTRTLNNIPVRIIDLNPDQTVLGLQSNGLL